MICISDHAADRARERYGLHLTQKTAGAIIADIRSGAAVLMQTQKDGRKIWLVRVSGKAVLVLTDPPDEFILTVLPETYFRSGESRRRAAWRKRTKRKFPDDLSERRPGG